MVEKTTTKEYHDKVVKKRLARRDVNMETKKQQHRELMQDAYNKAYDKVLEIIPEK